MERKNIIKIFLLSFFSLFILSACSIPETMEVEDNSELFEENINGQEEIGLVEDDGSMPALESEFIGEEEEIDIGDLI